MPYCRCSIKSETKDYMANLQTSAEVRQALNRDEIKALRKEIRELSDRIAPIIKGDICHDDAALNRVQMDVYDGLNQAASALHTLWLIAPVDDDPNKV